MEKIYRKILDFAEFLEANNKQLFVQTNIEGLKQNLAEEESFQEVLIDAIKEEVKEEVNYILTDKQILLCHTDEVEISWTRPAQKPGAKVLHGGFAFNGLTDALTMKTDFWAHSMEKYGKDLSADEKKFLTKLSWFESPTHHESSMYTPMYGCFELEENKFPDNIYFYDSATVYKLDMTIESYINNLIDSAAVYCWQYFYIDPDEIIKKNKGISGALWALTSWMRLPKENSRLENIVKYMEYCMECLPVTFTKIDFSYHKERLELLKSKLK